MNDVPVYATAWHVEQGKQQRVLQAVQKAASSCPSDLLGCLLLSPCCDGKMAFAPILTVPS